MVQTRACQFALVLAHGGAFEGEYRARVSTRLVEDIKVARMEIGGTVHFEEWRELLAFDFFEHCT